MDEGWNTFPTENATSRWICLHAGWSMHQDNTYMANIRNLFCFSAVQNVCFCHFCDRFALIRTVMPSTPVLGKPECYSRKCIMKVEQPVRTQHLEIQYRAEKQTWTTCQDSVRHFNSSEFENLGTFSEKSRSQRYHMNLWRYTVRPNRSVNDSDREAYMNSRTDMSISELTMMLKS